MNPDAFKPEVINAFHPDYMKTYHPDFTKEFRTVAANQEERKIKEPRKHIKKPITSVKVPKTGVQSSRPRNMTMEEVKAELLKITTFHVYSKAVAGR